MNKKILISLLILIVVCVLGILAILTGLFIVSRSASGVLSTPPLELPSTPEAQATNPLPQPLDTPIPVTPPKITGGAPSQLSSAQAAQMDEIQQQVISLRGLKPNKPVTRDLLTPAELQKKVETDFFKDYSVQDAKDDVLVLSTLGLLPRNFDLMDLYKRLYSEQIAGYYDSETKEMYVVQGKTFGGIERMTYAHEYTHTLQDQNYDLQNGLKLNDKNCRVETEYCSAVTALLEGDATFTEQEWMLGSTNKQDRTDIQNFYGSYSSPVYDSAPQYLQEDFLFPYKYGLEFVYSLKDRGGYSLVDQALKNPPVSTEQILHPDKYPTEKPIIIELPDLAAVLPGGWTRVEENVLGEWFTSLVLADERDINLRIPENTVKTAAAGWGGDRYALFTRQSDNAVVFVLHSRWDSQADANEFLSTLKLYGDKRWGNANLKGEDYSTWKQTPDGDVFIERQGLDTLWLITPDETIRQKVISKLTVFPNH